MDIKAIREALERLNGFTYHAADNQDAEDIKTVCAALFTIDPDTIRAEVRAEADSCIEALKRIRARAEKPGAASGEDAVYCFMEAEKALAAILSDEPKEREADEPQVGDEVFHRQMLLAFQDIRRKRRDEGMTEWADGDMAAWVMDRLPDLRSNRAEVERKLKEAER